jgi:hypothetical protein
MWSKTLPTHPRIGQRSLGLLGARSLWPSFAAEDGSDTDGGGQSQEDGNTGGEGGGSDGQNGKENDGHGADNFDPEVSKAALNKKNSENAGLRKRLKELEPLAAKAKELEDANKTELEKLTEDRTKHQQRGDTAEQEVLRLRVAIAKGLTLTQAKRLVGSTEEELTADADDLVASFGGGKKADDEKPKPAGKPKPNLRGGGQPDESVEETDPKKLAELIRRH